MNSINRRDAVRRRLRTTFAVVGVLCAVAACGGGHPADGSRAAEAKTATTPPESFPANPTARFQGAWPSPISESDPSDVLTLGAGLAYAYDRDDVGVTAFRLDTGETAWHTNVPNGSSVAQAPRVTGDVVIGAFATTEKGTGTNADRRGISVIAWNADTGETLWTRALGNIAVGRAVPRVVGADAQHVLVASYEHGLSETPPQSSLLETRTGRVIWTDADFRGVDLEQSVAVGVRGDGNFAGKSTSDGVQLWQRDLRLGEARSSDPGPALTFADGVAAGGTLLIDPATGATRLDSGDTSLEACRYDGWKTTICHGADGSGHAAVWAVDVHTAQVLWRLPDETANRIAPMITSAWHGVVYAQTDQAMTLDARTGEDLRTDIGLISPTMVNDDYGLVHDRLARGIDVYRATDASASG